MQLLVIPPFFIWTLIFGSVIILVITFVIYYRPRMFLSLKERLFGSFPTKKSGTAPQGTLSERKKIKNKTVSKHHSSAGIVIRMRDDLNNEKISSLSGARTFAKEAMKKYNWKNIFANYLESTIALMGYTPEGKRFEIECKIDDKGTPCWEVTK